MSESCEVNVLRNLVRSVSLGGLISVVVLAVTAAVVHVALVSKLANCWGECVNTRRCKWFKTATVRLNI